MLIHEPLSPSPTSSEGHAMPVHATRSPRPGESSVRVGTPMLTLRHATAAWRPTDDSCWPWGVAKGGKGGAQHASGSAAHDWVFSRVAAQPEDRKRPNGVAGAAVCPEHTRIEESKVSDPSGTELPAHAAPTTRSGACQRARAGAAQRSGGPSRSLWTAAAGSTAAPGVSSCAR